jgi:hypothetical protein
MDLTIPMKKSFRDIGGSRGGAEVLETMVPQWEQEKSFGIAIEIEWVGTLGKGVGGCRVFVAVGLAEDEVYAAGVNVVEDVVEGDIVNVVFYVVHEHGVGAFWGEDGRRGGRSQTFVGWSKGFG